jgi:hypothetical protein
MLQHSTLKHLPLYPGTWYRYFGQQKLMLRLAFLLPLFFLVSSFNGHNPGKTADHKKAGSYKYFDGGDFSLDFAAAGPSTYTHDGNLNPQPFFADKVESLEGGDFKCGDVVTYFTKITVDGSASGTQTIQLDYSFLANSTGQPGVSHHAIVDVGINTGDAAMTDGGTTSTATLLSGSQINGTEFTSGATLTGTVEIDGLEAGDVIIVYVNVSLACDPGAKPTGNLQGAITAGRVTSPAASTINVGNQTVPFKQVGQIVFAGCALPEAGPFCAGTTNTHTATALVDGATYEWDIAGNATFVGGGTMKTTIAASGEMTSSVDVIAGAAGSYTLSVTISKDGAQTQSCGVDVTVNGVPVTQTLNGGSFCESDASGAEVTTVGSESGVEYQLYDKSNDAPVGSSVSGTGSGLSFGTQPEGTYYVIATTTGSTCSTTFGDGSVTKNPLATITTGTYGPLCVNDAAVLLGGSPSGGVWSGTGVIDNGDGTYNFDPATAGVGGPYTLTYRVEATSTTCANSGTTTVTVNAVPTLTVHNLANVCPSNTVDLATAVDSYTGTLAYFTTANGTTTVSNPAAVGNGTYYVQATSTAGCKVRKAVTVTITICQGCTPGYWKNRKASWSTIKTTNDELGCVNYAAGTSITGDLKNASFWTVFGLTSLTTTGSPSARELRTGKGTNNLTLLQAVGLGDGSGYTQLARAATAALLDACGLSNYPYTSVQIISETKAVFLATISTQSRADALALAKKYDVANNNRCVLDNSVKTVTQRTEAPIVVDETPTTLSVATYPNPYSSNIRFVISNPKAGQGTLEVFNLLGQKVNTVYKGFIPAGNQSYNLNVPSLQRTTLMYRLSVGGTQVAGKLLHAKE